MVFSPPAAFYFSIFSGKKRETFIQKTKNIQSMCLLFGEESRNNTTAADVSASLFRPKNKSTTAVQIKNY
ncbi:hypothetical protein CUN21_02480 [Enterococcus faecalis]|nr:hypothetical protein [Enterococcus faecalis]EPH77327.1 hypothetical protein D926_00894 [Enterococcus faecalis D811610-10]EGO8622325.1 hypothetical protein [Enterococcus faecalis]EGO8799647.1 hypothetical protein [Enterococcus faecalis]EGO9161998.1 hypothetical protein [Enterococcus faecalis]